MTAAIASEETPWNNSSAAELEAVEVVEVALVAALALQSIAPADVDEAAVTNPVSTVSKSASATTVLMMSKVPEEHLIPHRFSSAPNLHPPDSLAVLRLGDRPEIEATLPPMSYVASA